MACVVLGGGVARAQDTPAPVPASAPLSAVAAPQQAAQTVPEGAEPPAAADPESVQPKPDATSLAQPAPARAASVDSGLAQLQLKLKTVSDERAHTNSLLPWLSVGVGAGAVLVGASVGAVKVLGCDDHCETPNWITFAVVAGATVATLGAIWVLHRDADIRELDSQRYQLEQELLRVRLSHPFHDESSAGARSTFSWRITL